MLSLFLSILLHIGRKPEVSLLNTDPLLNEYLF